MTDTQRGIKRKMKVLFHAIGDAPRVRTLKVSERHNHTCTGPTEVSVARLLMRH